MKEENVIYSERGGYTVADSFWGEGSSATWPFAKLEILKSKIIFWYFANKIEFNKNEIKYFDEYKSSRGKKYSNLIQIHHKKRNVKRCILFYSFRPRRLLEKIKQAGYKVIL